MKIKKTALFFGAAAGAFGIHSLIPAVYHKHYNPSVMRKTGEAGTVMLTFDDGPDPRYTGRILDLLREMDVKAVFFTVTREAAHNEALIDRMLKEGHVVGFHSIDHQNAMIRGIFHTKKDMEKGYDYLKKKGVHTIYYRPPWGLTNIATWHYVKKFSMKMVLWDVMAEDWEARASVSSIRSKCLRRVRSGSIICLHDGGERSGGAEGGPEKTLLALSYIIPDLKRAGYRFVLPDQS